MAQLPIEELVEAWASQEQDVMVGDDGNAYYLGRHIVDDADGGPDWRGIAAWCKRESYWPNVWTVNDHGNVELHDVKGNCYGGLV